MRYSLIILILLVSCSTKKTSTFENDPLNVYHFTLDNGLEVYLSQNKQTPKIHTEVVVKVGSFDDYSNQTGIAHYLEHMLFKGTSRIGTIDYKKEKPYLDKISELYDQKKQTTCKEEKEKIYKQIDELSIKAGQYAIIGELHNLYNSIGGSSLNAHTSFDETVYKVQIPSNSLEQWAMIESERFKNPVFRLFQSELEAVFEEKNMYDDISETAITKTLFSTMFPNHSYGVPIIGTTQHLQNPSLNMMKKYYNNFYTPNNMALVLCGDLDFKQTEKIIRKHFSSWTKTKEVLRKKDIVTPIKGTQNITLHIPTNEKVVFAYQSPIQSDKDAPALSICKMLLDNRQSGLLNKLVQDQKVLSAGSQDYFLKRASIQTFFGEAKKGQTIEDVKKLILEQIDNIKKGNFKEETLKAIIIDFEKKTILQQESNNSRASSIRNAFIRNSYQESLHYYEALKKVTKEDIIKVANKYFNDKRVEIICRNKEKTPSEKISKPNFTPIKDVNKDKSNFRKQIESLQKKELPLVEFDKTKVKQEELQENVDFYFYTNPLNNLASIKYEFHMGNAHNKKLQILAELLKNLTKKLNEDLYNIGCSFSLNIGENTSNMNISGLQEQLPKAIKLVFNAFDSIKFDSKTFTTLIDSIKRKRENRTKNIMGIMEAFSEYIVYKEESSFINNLSIEELDKLSLKEVADLLPTLLEQGQDISMVGTCSYKDAKKIASLYLKENHKVKKERIFPKTPENTDTVYFYHKPALKQATLFKINNSDKIDLKKEPLYILYNEYFAGSMGSILFKEIREKRSLAYATQARYKKASYPNRYNLYFQYIGCQADKLFDAIEVLDDITNNLPEDEKYFNTVKKAVLSKMRQSRITYKHAIYKVKEWNLFNISKDPKKELYDNINKTSLKDLVKFNNTTLKNKKFSYGILADKNIIDMKKLKSKYKVIMIDNNDIFSK